MHFNAPAGIPGSRCEVSALRRRVRQQKQEQRNRRLESKLRQHLKLPKGWTLAGLSRKKVVEKLAGLKAKVRGGFRRRVAT